MHLDPTDPIVITAVFGEQVHNFLNSDIGRYLVGRAEREASEATEQLKRCAPWRTRQIRKLQNTIWIAEHVQKWLGEAILDGRQAMSVIEGTEDE